MKTAPYYTITEEKPKQRDVYHDQTNCSDGRRILPENKRSGTGNRPKCDECISIG